MITALPSSTPLQKTVQTSIGEPATTDVLQLQPDASGIVAVKDVQKTQACRVVTRLPFVVRNNEVTLQEFLIF